MSNFSAEKIVERARREMEEAKKLRNELDIKISVLDDFFGLNTLPEEKVHKRHRTQPVKPDGFIGTEAIKNVLEKHSGDFVFIEDIQKEIANAWKGYLIDIKTLRSTLDYLKKRSNKTIQQDETRVGYYKLII